MDLFRVPRLESLGVPHGCTPRAAGDMQNPARRERIARTAGFGAPIRTFQKQLHGVGIFEVVSQDDPPKDVCGDGWILRTPGLAAGIFMADCVPLFLWDEDASVVGVFHAGWRGVASGMPEAAVKSFEKAGVRPGAVSAALGPHIGSCCYRVGPELEDRFASASLSNRGGGRYLDLGAEVRARLASAGVRPDAVSSSGVCTHCREQDCFSFRRDKIRRNMMAFVGVPE
ncbi:MAG: polyphenol oxidase family protein [Elusimicrobiota bacterium]